MKRKVIRYKLCCMGLVAVMAMAGCAGGNSASGQNTVDNDKSVINQGGDHDESAESQGGAGSTEGAEGQNGGAEQGQEEESMDYAELFKGMKLAKSYKGFQNNNPIIEQHYGADPFALVYGDEVYFYMTADAYEYDASKQIARNTYGKIRSLYVVSTKDMINFTDHGEITIAGAGGATKWAHNSWAPAAAWKEIDGKPKFFLYFADNGGGIGVVTSDSPVGPFVDELGHGLIRRDMENCGNVEWLFDPAVLVDDDGKAYIYFGGGVPQGKASHPMTARCAQLGDDMMSLVDVQTTIDAPYLFEDSGIHKYGDTYYYTYCSNFSVDKAGTDEYGMENGEICVMTSKSPLGPFTYSERILKNPGYYFPKNGGNNHHAIFQFKDQWYITYHTRLLEIAQDIELGYRSTSIDEFSFNEDGTIGNIRMTKDARKQVGNLNPYETINGATFAVMGGVDTAPADEVSKKYGCGNLLLTAIESGDYVKLQGVDFGDKGATTLKAVVKTNGKDGAVRMTNDFLSPNFTAYLPIKSDGQETTVCEVKFDAPITGVQDVYFTFSGEGYEIVSWIFE
ncbi:MAG: family 43 glycosylhydrolase [Lachnospiraceae bacterium]|nr:family 43 glycosylhydrolase [Lachnospiraceae bacterium]